MPKKKGLSKKEKKLLTTGAAIVGGAAAIGAVGYTVAQASRRKSTSDMSEDVQLLDIDDIQRGPTTLGTGSVYPFVKARRNSEQLSAGQDSVEGSTLDIGDIPEHCVGIAIKVNETLVKLQTAKGPRKWWLQAKLNGLTNALETCVTGRVTGTWREIKSYLLQEAAEQLTEEAFDYDGFSDSMDEIQSLPI